MKRKLLPLMSLFMAVLLPAGAALAAEPAPDAAAAAAPAQGALAIDTVQALYEQAQANTSLDEALKAHLVELLGRALERLRSAEEWNKKSASYDALLVEGPQQIDALRKQLEELDSAKAEEGPEAKPGESEVQLDLQLAQAEAALGTALADLAALEEESSTRGERRRQLSDLIAAAREQAAGVKEEEATEPWFIPQLAEARTILATAERADYQAQADALAKESSSFDLRGQLLEVRLDLALRQVGAQEKQVQQLRTLVAARRKEAALAAAQEADNAILDAAQATPAIRQTAQSLAAENKALVEARTGENGLLILIDQAGAKLEEIEGRLKALQEDYKKVSESVAAAGINSSMGRLLRDEKEKLPSLRELRRDIRLYQQHLADAEVKLIEHRVTSRDLVQNGATSLDALGKQIPESLPAAQRRNLENLLRNLHEGKQKALKDLIRDYEAYSTKLTSLKDKTNELIQETQRFTTFINENILWVRSGATISLSDFMVASKTLVRLADMREWAALPRVFSAKEALGWASNALLVAWLLLCAVSYRRMRRGVDTLSARARQAGNVSIRPTIDALIRTVVLTLPLPVLLLLIGWRLNGFIDLSEHESIRNLGVVLRNGALLAFPLEFARQALRPKGLFDSHFGYPSAALRLMRRHLYWFGTLAAVVFIACAYMNAIQDDIGQESLGRFLYLGALAGYMVFSDRMLRPSNGAFPLAANVERKPEKRWWYRLLWVGSLALALVLGGFAVAGYLFTAHQLTLRLLETLFFVFILILVRGLILRWMLLARRHLAIEQARRKREAREREAREGGSDTAEFRAEPPPEEFAFDLARLDQQTYRLLQSTIAVIVLLGAWFIWLEELPALAVIKTVEIWSGTGVTLGNLAVAFLSGVFTFIAAANIPGFVELTILHRLKLVKGERYAVTTIVRYIIAIAGVIITFNAVGIKWEKLQWLVAALSVGLGFGLQEIFANFISGLIILFEQPIRVGDTVTVGGISGTVTRIRIRATSITDFDCKELIVPNKEFVTSKILNWTLNDALLRLVIPIGVAAGTDMKVVQRLLHEVAAGQEDVLEQPPPRVVFNGFGDNMMSLELRLYFHGVDNLVPVRNDVNIEIERVLREHGIEYRLAKDAPDSAPGKL